MPKKELIPAVTMLRDLVNQRMKRNVLSMGSEVLASDIVGYIPTGWTMLDANLGGGIPLGRTVEIFGEESVGKSSLVWQAIANCQRQGGTAVLFEPETSFPKELAARMGVDVDRLLVLNPDTFMEEVFSLFLNLSELIRGNAKLSGSPILLVWDTLAATPTRAEHEAMRAGEDMARTANPFRAQIIRSGMRALSVTLAKTSTSLVIVNHVFADIQRNTGRGPNTATPGGRGVKYHASARINLWAGAYLRPKGAAEGAEPEGVVVTAKVEKNKLGVPKRKVKSRFYYGHGYDDDWAVFDYLAENGLIRQSSSWYYLPHPAGGAEIKTYSTGFKDRLQENPGLIDHLRLIATQHYCQQVVVGKDEDEGGGGAS